MGFLDSFKRREEVAPYTAGESNGYDAKSSSSDPEKGVHSVQPAAQDDNTEQGLQRNLKGRHMQMIAFGGSIGTGLFIGSGGALATGGPGFLLIDYILIGVMLFMVVMALGEMATVFPVSGSFAAYGTRFIDPAWGFAMGYNYWMQWFIVLPLELVAATIVIQYWDPDHNIPQAVWIIVFVVAISIINFFGVRGYGEFEFVASMIKIIAVIGFIILGIVISAGGVKRSAATCALAGTEPDSPYSYTGCGPTGARYWHNPGAFNNGFKGFCTIFVAAAFAFAGTELIGLAAAETGNPRKEVPRASKQVFWRILLFYVVSLFMITLLVPNNSERLKGKTSYDAKASPFVIAISDAGIRVLPDIYNSVILVSVLSVGNSAVYGASRTLVALAQMGQAPSIFTYIDRKGRPLPAVILSLVVGFLAFLVYSTSNGIVFSWLLALSGLSSIITWGSICACHIRFRSAWKLNGHTVEELPWASPVGVVGSWYGMIFCMLVVIAQFYTAAFPIGATSADPAGERVNAFFQAYLSVPVVAVFFIIGKVLFRTKWVKLEEIDVVTGRRDVPLDVLRQERAEAKARPLPKKLLSAAC